MSTEPLKGDIRVRMAPSPTGYLHIGTARTTLFNWLFARHTNGTFILRIEDTDTERSSREFEQSLIEGLHWLGLEWDEGPDYIDGVSVSKGPFGPYRQSERKAIYRKYLEQLLAEKKAYFCYCTKEELEGERQSLSAAGLLPKYGGRCRALSEAPAGREASTIRFVVPEKEVEFSDLVRGKMKFDAALFGDIVIAKDLDSPLYNFAVVVDDFEMKISHVIRGEDHISNTPKQLLLQEALGFPSPQYGHIPLILNSDRSKLSKRTNKTSLIEYRDEGYLPQAMVNFLALLGWHPKDDREVLSIADIAKEFDLSRVQKAGAIFNLEKLNWLNAQYLKMFSDEDIALRARAYLADRNPSSELLKKIVSTQRERMVKLSDIRELSKFIFDLPEYDPAILVWKKSDAAATRAVLASLAEVLSDLSSSDWHRKEAVIAAIDGLVALHDRGTVYWPLRVALSGLAASPDPMALADILGKEEGLRRLEIARKKIS